MKMTNKELIKFHTQRVAFLIINNSILFLKNSPMSHREWFATLSLNIDFDEIVRWYFFENKIIFYKADCLFDKMVIIAAKKFYPIIQKELGLENPEIWVGIKKDSDINPWPPVKQLR